MFDVDNLIKYRESQLLSYRGYYNHVAMIFEKNNILPGHKIQISTNKIGAKISFHD